jgi:hypothetical protein
MLEEFLMPLQEEENTDDILFQKDGMPPLFQNEVTSKITSFYTNRLAEVGLPLVQPDVFFWGSSGMLRECHHWLTLYRNLLGE